MQDVFRNNEQPAAAKSRLYSGGVEMFRKLNETLSYMQHKSLTFSEQGTFNCPLKLLGHLRELYNAVLELSHNSLKQETLG